MATYSNDTETVMEVLNACRLKLISKSLQICYDDQGSKYDLPVFILNAPERFEIQKEETSNYNGKKVKVKLQYLNHLNEAEFSLDSLVGQLQGIAVEMVKKVEVYEENLYAIRLVYQGKVFKDELKLGFYLKADSVVQIFKTLKK